MDFNTYKIYIGDIQVNKAYLGETLIKGSDDTPPKESALYLEDGIIYIKPGTYQGLISDYQEGIFSEEGTITVTEASSINYSGDTNPRYTCVSSEYPGTNTHNATSIGKTPPNLGYWSFKSSVHYNYISNLTPGNTTMSNAGRLNLPIDHPNYTYNNISYELNVRPNMAGRNPEDIYKFRFNVVSDGWFTGGRPSSIGQAKIQIINISDGSIAEESTPINLTYSSYYVGFIGYPQGTLSYNQDTQYIKLLISGVNGVLTSSAGASLKFNLNIVDQYSDNEAVTLEQTSFGDGIYRYGLIGVGSLGYPVIGYVSTDYNGEITSVT